MTGIDTWTLLICIFNVQAIKDATRVFSFLQLGISYVKEGQSTKALEYYEKSKLIALNVGNEKFCEFLDTLIDRVSI